jgi:hypothetical protein
MLCRCLPLDSAPSAENRRMTVDRRLSLNPNRNGFSTRCDFGGDRWFDLAYPRLAGYGPGPFRRAPDADRETRSATHGRRTSTKVIPN